LKRFKVYVGLEENNLIKVLDDGLKNDCHPETFQLSHSSHPCPVPCRYIKIAAIVSWGPSFNFSIWHVELHGLTSPKVVQPKIHSFLEFKEKEVIRYCLKHFRDNNYMSAFHALESSTSVKLEQPLVTKLHQYLVEQGDFNASEEIIEEAAEELMSDYINNQEYQAIWTRIKCDQKSCEDQVEELKPGMRGGHQMCLDYKNDQVYVFGGWNGVQDMADFWRFDINQGQWTLLSQDTSAMGGPTPRSCHKMCIDCKRGKIYTLGRYLDTSKRSQLEMLDNELHVFDINTNRWHLLCKDVFTMGGGPRLIFDHQMCFDDETNTIYVFGGRVLVNSHHLQDQDHHGHSTEFSGLYSYQVDRDLWTLLREDSGNAGPEDIRSRIGHSMLLDSKNRRLYIFGGQRLKEDVNDLLYYDLEHDRVHSLCDNTSDAGIPPPGFTQRATIDDERGEIYMLAGLSKDRSKREGHMHNTLWIFGTPCHQWRCVYRGPTNNHNHGNHGHRDNDPDRPSRTAKFHGNDSAFGSSKLSINTKSSNVTYRNRSTDCKDTRNDAKISYGINSNQPCPRYAHQLVYHPYKKIHYMFGGNPGRREEPNVRLDDFWELKLTKPDKSFVIKKCKYLIRKQRFCEMASRQGDESHKLVAMEFLRTRVHEVVDHECASSERKYRHLASKLFGDCRHLVAGESDYESDGEEVVMATSRLANGKKAKRDGSGDYPDKEASMVRANRTNTCL